MNEPIRKVLIVEDDEIQSELLKRILKSNAFEVFECKTIAASYKILLANRIDVILLDSKLPDGNGVEFVAEIKKRAKNAEIILYTGYSSIKDGVKAIKEGAFDYLIKGEDNNRLIIKVNEAAEKAAMSLKFDVKLKGLAEQCGLEAVIGESPLILQAKKLASKVLNFDAVILLLGETGTGKEVFAQAIHYSGNRRLEPFIAVNCSAISKNIFESELFGHKAGAFTGALKDKKGLFEIADGGTIFLDEIGEISLDMQAKLLRALENGTFIKVGDTQQTKVNCRVISATNKDLKKGIADGTFREDLYYRISAFTIELPALRDRHSDNLLLANYFIEKLSERMNKGIKKIDPLFMEILQKYNWPGNVRELKNVIERSIIMCDDELTPEILNVTVNRNNTETMEDVEASHLRKILLKTNNNKTQAAKILGMPLSTLYRRLEYLKIK